MQRVFASWNDVSFSLDVLLEIFATCNFKNYLMVENIITKMHSSRMCTVRYSGRRGVCLPGEGVSAREGVSAQGWGVCPGIRCLPRHSPVNRMTDRRLWKYYLAATTLRTVKIGNCKIKGGCKKNLDVYHIFAHPGIHEYLIVTPNYNSCWHSKYY